MDMHQGILRLPEDGCGWYQKVMGAGGSKDTEKIVGVTPIPLPCPVTPVTQDTAVLISSRAEPSPQR